MASLSGMTLAQMRAATVTAIRTAMKARIDTLTKVQLIRLELWVREWEPANAVRLADDAAVTYHPDGQIASRLDVERDESGAKLGSRLVEWTYYPSGGEVNTISVTQRDANDVQTARRVVQHYTDGKQPTISN